MDQWATLFQGEVGAAATLAGLLFVSVSVNQARILELGRMADRGGEALLMLLLALVVATLPLVPAQPLRLLGGEIFLAGAVMLIATVQLQRIYLRDLEQTYRRKTFIMVLLNRLAVSSIALAGLILIWRGDEAGLYLLPVGILVTFGAAGASAWVLLIEINR